MNPKTAAALLVLSATFVSCHSVDSVRYLHENPEAVTLLQKAEASIQNRDFAAFRDLWIFSYYYGIFPVRYFADQKDFDRLCDSLKGLDLRVSAIKEEGRHTVLTIRGYDSNQVPRIQFNAGVRHVTDAPEHVESMADAGPPNGYYLTGLVLPGDARK